LPQDAGSRAIILRSGLRHFSADADIDIFDKRAERNSVDRARENRRLNGVEYLRFMELLPIPLIASVHGLQPVLPHLAGEFEFRFPPATFRALSGCFERLRSLSVRRSSATAISRNERFGMTAVGGYS
jgi:hypothetical protein